MLMRCWNQPLDMRAEPLPIVTVRFVIGTDTPKATAVLTRDLSDLVTIVEPETVLNDDFYIESFTHQMTSEYDHEVVVGCELQPPAGTVTASTCSSLAVLCLGIVSAPDC